MWDAGKDSERLALRKQQTHKPFKSRRKHKMYFNLFEIIFNHHWHYWLSHKGVLASFAVTHRLSQSLFTRKVQSQRTLIISRNCSNATGRMQNNSSQCTRRTPKHHQKPSSAFLPRHCCVVFRGTALSQRPRLMNSRQLVGLKFIDRTATSPSAFLPGRSALIVQSVRSICYWAALLAWQQRAGSITAIAWWLRREQRGHAC